MIKRNKKILVIEDDQEQCEELVEILQDKGYDVESACNGETGKQYAEQHHPDIIILDLKLPKINGFDILNSLKKKNSLLKIIVVTAKPPINTTALRSDTKNTLLHEKKTLSLANAILHKPFDIEFLLSTIKQLTT